MPRGAFISLDQCWKLARAWYPDRVKSEWRRKDVAGMKAVFDDVGLEGEFWRVL